MKIPREAQPLSQVNPITLLRKRLALFFAMSYLVPLAVPRQTKFLSSEAPEGFLTPDTRLAPDFSSSCLSFLA